MNSHITVLAEEAVDALHICETSTVVDATLGSGGHARSIISKLGSGGTFIGLDVDPKAVELAQEALTGKPTLHFYAGNFRDIDSILDDLTIGKVHAVLADLGWRMEQFGGNGKGFSFLVDEPLNMTFGDEEKYLFTAYDIVNSWEEEHIENILTGYGEERFARRIARKIVEVRAERPITTTSELVSVIKEAVPAFYLHRRIHPATRTFQALRIAVNDELKALEAFITASVERLEPCGRLAIITFHSLEDRIVKHAFRQYAEEGRGTLITKKPITPSDIEISKNPRARSAKLRTFERHE